MNRTEIIGRIVRGAGAAGCILAAISACVSPPVQAGDEPAIGRVTTDAIFAHDSFWYKPIPPDAPLNPESEAYVAEFLRMKSKFYGTVGIATSSWASPVYRVGKDVPTVRVTRNCYNKPMPKQPSLEDDQWAAVPIPAYAQPAKGSDAEMTIYQPSTDTIWEFWKTAKRDDGGWQACWGGRMDNVSKSPGNWPKGYGTTATGLPFLGGQITAEELQRGEIRHAIGIALPEAESRKIFSWPAKRSDGWNPKGVPNRIPEGLRFRLDPTVDVDALRMHPLGKVIAKAAQKYGFIVWDTAGAIGIRAENPLSYMVNGGPNPYATLFAGTASYDILKNFPWDRLQFLPMDYGKPAHVPP